MRLPVVFHISTERSHLIGFASRCTTGTIITALKSYPSEGIAILLFQNQRNQKIAVFTFERDDRAWAAGLYSTLRNGVDLYF